ncbi:hypothetical protein GCK32_020296 [Trichostrongylus colubriformis]|uniref:Uncharacterized protein n=1 Tax=Trichostrongylus colubriformis TaxID=6319 RepID=A0AAN8FHY1_TRICO
MLDGPSSTVTGALRLNGWYIQVTLRQDRPPIAIPFIEVPHLEDSLAFRERSLQVINDLFAGTYVDIDVADQPLTSSTEHPYAIAPTLWNGIRPVLYQIVSTGWGTGVVLEVKDFFAIGPDRRDLHCITLDQHGIEILRGGRGFNRSLVSVKDFVWVYNVKPTRQALKDPAAVLEQSRIPRTTALDTSSVYFFRASHFAFAKPTDREEPIYGIILSLGTRRGRVISARAAFEGCPEAVTITPFLCTFPMDQLALYEVVSARSRANVSSAMRFSEPPVSFEARDHLANVVRCFFPMHPEEGILPLSVDRITQEERDWLSDRLNNFTSYLADKDLARKRLGKICNAACSALAAVNSAEDDRRSHRSEATVVTPEWFPMRLRVVLSDMTSEAGWTSGRQAVLWIPGASRLIRLKVVDVQAATRDRTLTVVLQAFRWSNNSLTDDIDRFEVDLHCRDAYRPRVR